jgi:transposase InsO family protein
LADRVLLKIVYLLVRRLLGLVVLVVRKDLAKDAELLVLRHENAVLRRHAGRIRYEPTDRVWFAAVHRARHPPDAPQRRHRKSHRGVDSPASPQPRSHPRPALRGHALIRDRGSNFTASFDAVFQATGTRILHTAVQAPRMNATCERLVGTLRRELLDRVMILGETHLHAVLTDYQAHYNTARPHQGIAQRVPDDEPDAPRTTVTDVDRQQIHRKPVLGGLINEYAHAA